MNKFTKTIGLMLTGLVINLSSAFADDKKIQSNNPLATLKVAGIENIYYGDLKGIPRNDNANALMLRYASPLKTGNWDWVYRFTLPINTAPVGRNGGVPDFSNKTGVGDLNFISIKLMDMGNPAISFGIGPQLTIPTASKKALGSEKWSAGLTNVLFNAESKLVQWGYLLTWQGSFAGDNDRKGVSAGAFEPLLYVQLGEGWYARSSATMTYDFKTDDYAVPIGLGGGRVFAVSDKAQINAFFEPAYYVARKGEGQPRWGFYAGIDLNY